MSGHSKWATIHRQKETQDAKRGLLFSKLTRAITIAAHEGANPDANFKLRLAIDRARDANMPKENIERAIAKASGSESAEEVMYEGFGPSGISVIVQSVTDNKNRTAQEMKSLFERGGGKLGSPGSVSYQFESMGELLVEKKEPVEEQILTLIDSGAQDVEETEDGIEVYVSPATMSLVRESIQSLGFTVKRAELSMRPKTLVTISDPSAAKKAINFLETLEAHDDVQNVYANMDIQDNKSTG